jgi:alkylation response protein AidB-like acyl-CoA dehydrogenase
MTIGEEELQPTGEQASTAAAPGSAQLQQLLEAIGSEAEVRERKRENPYGAIELIRASRLGALRVPREQGGAGATVRQLFEVLLDLAAADTNVAHILRSHFWFVEERLASADAEVRARWIRAVADGEIFGNASSELNANDVGGPGMETLLRTDTQAGYRLNGIKYYCTGTLYSDRVAVITPIDDGRMGSAIVPVDREGVTVKDDWDGMGQQLTGTGTVALEDVAVAPDEIVLFPPYRENEPLARSPLMPFLQLYLTAIIAGNLRNVLRDARAVVNRRRRTYTHASGQTPATDPLIQEVVGDIASHAYAAEAIVLAAADTIDEAVDSIADGRADQQLADHAALRASEAKVVVDALGLRCAAAIFDVGGASATKQEYNLDRHWRNIRTLASHNPTIYKARAVGDYVLNGERLPINGFF